MMMGPGAKARDFRGSMARLFQTLKPYRLAFIIVGIFAIASTVFNIVGPKMLGRATTTLFEGVIAQIAGTGSIDFEAIGEILLTMAALYLMSSAFGYIQGWVMSGVSARLTYQFRKDISEKLNRLPLSYFDRTSHGDVLSRVTNDVDVVSHTLNQSLTHIVTSTITVLGVLVMMLSISWQMTLVSLFVIPLSLVFTQQVVRRSQKYFVQQQETLGHMNGHVEEMYGGHLEVKAFNGEARSVATFDWFNGALYSSAWKSQFLSGLMMPINTFIGNLGYVMICIIGAAMTARGNMTIGGIQAFIQYVRSFNRPISQLANISNQLQMVVAAAERVFEFLEEREEPDPADPVRLTEVAGQVDFDHVRFGYTADKVVIRSFGEHPAWSAYRDRGADRGGARRRWSSF